MKIYESSLPIDHRKDEIGKVLDFVTTGKFCQLVCLPGAGKATVLRLLAHNRPLLKSHLGEKEGSARFAYINMLGLSDYSEAGIAKLLIVALDKTPHKTGDPLMLKKQLTEAVNQLSLKNINTVLLFDHFDEYQNRLSRSFFQTLKDLKSSAKYKFSVVFATRRDLKDLIDPEILKDYYDFFIDNTIYLKVQDKSALESLFTQIETVFNKKLVKDVREKIISLTGGHVKLTKVLAEIYLRGNDQFESETLLLNPIVQAALFEIWLAQTAHEQQALIDITQSSKDVDASVLDSFKKFNLLDGDNKITVPLFAQFIKKRGPELSHQKITFNPDTKEITKGTTIISDLLSPQEYRLLRFLIGNRGRIVERDEIIKAVWPEAKSAEGISDEAIDQMIFRLRKKIEDEPNNPGHILTVKGLGIRFEP
ncbi:winged helix-turn-helix domain-containing protein [Candidatus Curtissbacteria bacterium]|nr:winged helix-turn-helix domain-containing protein [Candidatus Curtissbacteria bacterium]